MSIDMLRLQNVGSIVDFLYGNNLPIAKAEWDITNIISCNFRKSLISFSICVDIRSKYSANNNKHQ